MAILLASPPFADTFGYSMPPPGLLRLGGFVREAGFEVHLEDLAFRFANGELPATDELGLASAEFLLECMEQSRGPWALGLSTMGATLPIALVIARIVRERIPNLPILLGGPGTTGSDESILERFPFVDAIVRGEGEATLCEMLTQRQSGQFQYEGIPGVTWRNAQGAVVREADRIVFSDLDEVATPAWDLLPTIASYKRITGAADGLVPIDSGRGCAFDCSFCTIGRYWGRRSRTLSPERLADEVLALERMPGAKSAYLCHDIFGANRAAASDFCTVMKQRAQGQKPFPWEVRARVDHLDYELIEEMASAGCYRVLLGIESSSDEVRRAANKPFQGAPTRVDILKTVQHLSEAGVTPILSLILGLPGEGDPELRDTLDFAAEASLAGAAQLSFHLVNPQPGCDLGESFAKESSPVDGIAPDMALGAGLTEPEQELIRAMPDLFSSWSLLTGLPGGEAHLLHLSRIAKTLPEALMRYPRTIAAVKRVLNLDTLDFANMILERTCSLEGIARELNHPLVDDLLLWEMSRLRVAARGPVQAQGQAPMCVHVDTIAVRFELATIDQLLAKPGVLPAPLPDPIFFAVGAKPGTGEGGSSVQTLRITPDLAKLLDILRAGAIEPGGPLGDKPLDTIEHLANVAEGCLVSMTQSPTL
jgi:tRNA A37 methylthiotransferase MiaB